jgi:hypothetical protein
MTHDWKVSSQAICSRIGQRTVVNLPAIHLNTDLGTGTVRAFLLLKVKQRLLVAADQNITNHRLVIGVQFARSLISPKPAPPPVHHGVAPVMVHEQCDRQFYPEN